MFKITKSQYLDSIYYADLFKIKGKIWLIMGHGKSHAAVIASDNKREADLGRDSFAIAVQDGRLCARYDMGGMAEGVDPAQSPFYVVDVIAYCLNETQTKQHLDKGSNTLLRITAEEMAYLSTLNLYPASLAKHVTTPDELDELCDPTRREQKFREVTTSAGFENFWLVPFTQTLEDKARLYVNHSAIPSLTDSQY